MSRSKLRSSPLSGAALLPTLFVLCCASTPPPAPPPPPPPPDPGLVAPAEVTITDGGGGYCVVTPAVVEVVFDRTANSIGPVRWIVPEGTRAKITPKTAAVTFPDEEGVGHVIRRVYNKGKQLLIDAAAEPVRPDTSGVRFALVLVGVGEIDEGAILWKYDVELRDAANAVVCTLDPEVCVRTRSGACAY